jgi:hypothetical protein
LLPGDPGLIQGVVGDRLLRPLDPPADLGLAARLNDGSRLVRVEHHISAARDALGYDEDELRECVDVGAASLCSTIAIAASMFSSA